MDAAPDIRIVLAAMRFSVLELLASAWTTDTLTFPLYAATISALVLIIRSLTRLRRAFDSESTTKKYWKDITKYGGLVILKYNIFRLFACVTLLGLSITSVVVSRGDVAANLWIKLGLTVFFLYGSLLAAAAISVTTKAGFTAAVHLNLILAVAFGVYFYRDILPLASYTRPMQDEAEGSIIWAKLIALTLAAVIVPSVTPRPYIPVDPNNSMPMPNPEQTASLLSLATISFLDPVIMLAYKLPHLPYDLLPPLADTDAAENLKKRAFPNIDTFSGATRRHIFFGILKTFRCILSTLLFLIIVRRNECATNVLLLLFYGICTFASPIGINRVLAYLESDPDDLQTRPFVWILWLVLGPVTGTIALASHTRLAKRILVQVEGMLTELIFEHALRARVKADTDERQDESSGDKTPSHTDMQSEANSATEPGTPSKGSKGAHGGADATKSSFDVGKISNLVTTDLRNVTSMSDFLLLFFYTPVAIVSSVVFLYVVLGWSSLAGMATMLILLPLVTVAARLLQDIQKNRIEATDARIRTISETMNIMRMIKLFSWEEKMLGRVNEKREEELKWIFKREIFETVANVINIAIPIVTMVVTYVTYVRGPTSVMRQELRPSIVFSTMPVFEMLRIHLINLNYRSIQFIDTKVSIDRINGFLHNTELLDVFTEKEETAEELLDTDEEAMEIGFREATFTWSNENDGTATLSKHRFTLRIDDELLFKRGCINLILGPTGAGKTSLLMALLGEMHFVPASPRSWYNLPRVGGVAYAAQESWILNETIRDNILFGSEYDEERYKKVVYQCGLEQDLELFEAGDKTEVGEKGQKARCTLARAIYSNAEILLLDDVLAALDVHTAKHIVENCMKGDLVKGRTIILVTHNVALAAPIADFAVSIGSNGLILGQGSAANVLQHDTALQVANEVNTELEVLEQLVDPAPATKVVIDNTENGGKLILEEELQIGQVRWNAVILYLRGLGGLTFYSSFIGLLIVSNFVRVYETWYLGYWASLYETSPRGSISVSYHIGIYVLLATFDAVTHAVSSFLFAFAILRASRTIHLQLSKSIIGTSSRWLDVTPVSRVIARFTADINAVDGPIVVVFWEFVFVTMSMLSSFCAITFLTPLFAIPGVVVAVIGRAVGQLYLKTQLSVKRERSNAKAPVLAQMARSFGAAIAGLPSIRAYGAQNLFIQESLRRINKYTRVARTLENLDRWIAVRLSAVGNGLIAILVIYLVYFHKERAYNVGFILNMAAAFSMRILFWVRVWNDVQVEGNSLERILQYIHIEQEAKPTEAGRPPAHWPSSGELVVENLSASYSPGGPKVLRNISFRIKSGERVGIVGRTGSGKSSLTLALLRCIYTDGTVYYDGVKTSSVNLDALRSNITIIPQMPELLSGTLRHNLDPFGHHDDTTLNGALRAAGLFALQEDMAEGRLELDSAIASGGGNLSVGQRQILALARAIVRDSKLLILDEATSAIDYRTDAIIQASLRNELKPDVTVITVAHRLQTILDSDKIMVLEEGCVAEFDVPEKLLINPMGKLRALVDESGDKEALHAMANGGRAP